MRKDENIAEIGGGAIIGTKDEDHYLGQIGHLKRLHVVNVGTQAGTDEMREDVITKMNVKISDDMATIMNQGDAVETMIEEIDVSHHLDAPKRLLKK